MKLRKIKLIDPVRYHAASAVAVVSETAQQGAGSVTFNLDQPVIALKNVERLHLNWVKERKCADGAFIGRKNGKIHLHLVELKLTLSLGLWNKVIRQYEGVLLDALAFLGVVGSGRPAKVYAHIAYTIDAISVDSSPAPIFQKFGLGTGVPIIEDFGWTAGVIDLLDFKGVTVNRIKRHPQTQNAIVNAVV